MSEAPTHAVSLPETQNAGVILNIRREDLLHPQISGNKFRKLHYNLLQAKKEGHHTLLGFGGAYSNQIAALARAGHINGFRTIGVIRGEEVGRQISGNRTLSGAMEDGMTLKFLTRTEYRNKDSKELLQALKDEFGPFYLLPEGGTNALAVKGCEEILTPADQKYQVICCAVGTGGTLAGLIRSAHPGQRIIGFPALKAASLRQDICSFVPPGNNNWHLQAGYEFGGYAKINRSLVAFMNRFREHTGIPLDPVYTGKMCYGILDMITGGAFPPGTQILAVHTGGLQGIAGMNAWLDRKNLPLIA